MANFSNHDRRAPLTRSPHTVLAAVLFNPVFYIHYWQLTVGSSRRCKIQQYGCQPMRPFPELDTISYGLRCRMEALERKLRAAAALQNDLNDFAIPYTKISLDLDHLTSSQPSSQKIRN